MTTENKELKQIQETIRKAGASLGMVADRIDGDVKFRDWLDITNNQIEEAIESLNKYQERLNSEQLVEDVVKTIRCATIDKFCGEKGMSIEYVGTVESTARAAINVIIGK